MGNGWVVEGRGSQANDNVRDSVVRKSRTSHKKCIHHSSLIGLEKVGSHFTLPSQRLQRQRGSDRGPS